MEILKDSADVILDNAREKFSAAGVTEFISETVIGDPASSILEYAERNQADLPHRARATRSGSQQGLVGWRSQKARQHDQDFMPYRYMKRRT
jgi:hypothetical protein